VSTPRASIIIPLYNLRRWVAEAIDSALAQTLPPGDLQVIVVDDGSTDGSGEVAQGYGARIDYVRQENRGLSAARNTGLGVARAPYVAFLDADDRIHPEKVAAELAVFAGRPAVGVVYSGFRYIDADGHPLPQRGWSRFEGDVLPRLVLGNIIHPHQALVRRDAVLQAGAFDERLTSVEDWDVWLRVSSRGATWACVDRALADYRIRPGSMSQNPGRMAENRLAVLAKLFADPALPAAVAGLRARAYERAYLVSAADYYRGGDRSSGARWLEAAVRARPAVVADQEALSFFCQGLLPLGHQGGGMLAREWRRVATTLRTAIDDVRAMPGASLAGGVWSARLARWRTITPLVRRRVKDLMLGRDVGPSPR
jgi:GT2 family glycosyltransferase